MEIDIELIGYLRTRGLPNGQKNGKLKLANGTTLVQLLDLLELSQKAPLLIAVNDRVPDDSYTLQDGDAVQFAPPIVGG